MIETLTDSFMAMETMLQVYWGLAIVSSVIFVIQTVASFIGFDSDSDMDLADSPDAIPESGDADFDAYGFHLISVKSILCFIVGLGWTGVLFWDSVENRLLLAALSMVVGLIFMSVIAFLLFQMKKLDKDNTFRTEKVIGMTAEVYLRIPANHSDSGKINVSLNGSMHELEAFTDGEEIPTGARVRITQKNDGGSVIVEKL